MENHNLICVGYWKSYTDEELPSPFDFVDNTIDLHQRTNLANYLAAGKIQVLWRGYSYCRFCNLQGAEMGHACLTDGKYIWPEGLAHYIRLHEVWLPNEFTDHVLVNLNRNWERVIIDKSIISGDLSWWKNAPSRK